VRSYRFVLLEGGKSDFCEDTRFSGTRAGTTLRKSGAAEQKMKSDGAEEKKKMERFRVETFELA
jgi:hypothetical protein